MLRLIANKQPIPQSYQDHALSKNSPAKYQGCRDVHIAPNIVVVYTITDTDLNLVAIGSHQDLNLTEALT